MFHSINHKPTFSVAMLLILVLFTQLLAPPVAVVIANAAKTESATNTSGTSDANATETILSVLPRPQPAPTVALNAPAAPTMTATLTDNIAAATKVAPGGSINYTAVISNTAGAGNDATNVNFSDTLDANTTLTAGSIHASPIAANDTYNWVGNTFLDTTARALPAVTANDVAVNAPGGTDTFTVTTIAGGATTLSGTVSLAANGSFTYTPPLGRPNAGDGASVNDSFTYTITNNADPSLTSTGTVTITLTGRVWYLQAGAAGDGRSNTPSGSPSAMSTAADKSTDIFYIFSNAGSLNGLFSLDNGQQLLGQGVDLVANSITLFTAGAAPTTTDSTGNGVTLATGASNTISGFNIGNCSGSAIASTTNFGTLTVSNMAINSTGQALNLSSGTLAGTGFSSVTSSGGTNNIALTSVNGTIALGSGALSGASGTSFLDTGSNNATITFSGTITKTSAGKIADIQNHTGNNITLSGNLTCNTSCTGLNVANNSGGTIGFSGGTKTINTGTNQAVTLSSNTGATINFSNGGLAISTTTANGFDASGGGTTNVTTGANDNTISSTTGRAFSASSVTFGASGVTFKSISANGGNNGITLQSTSGNFTVAGDGTGHANGSGGTIQNITGGVIGNAPVYLLTSSGTITLKSMNMSITVNAFSGMLVDNNAGGTITVNVTGCTFTGVQAGNSVQQKALLQFEGGNTNPNAANVTANVQDSFFFDNRTYGVVATAAGDSVMNFTLNQSGFGTEVNSGAPVNNPGTTITNPPPFSALVSNGSNAKVDYSITNNTFWGADGLKGAIYVVSISGSGSVGTSHLNGSFIGNHIGKAGVTGSGCAHGCAGLGILPGVAGTFNATITNNDIRQINADGGIALVNSVGGGATFTSNLHIKNNTLAEPDTTGSPTFLRAIVVSSGNSGCGATPCTVSVCAEIGGTLAGEPNIISGAWTSTMLRVTNNNNSTALQLPSYGGAATDTAAVNSYLSGRNGGATSSSSAGTVGFTGGGACPLLFAEGGVMALKTPSLFSSWINSALSISADRASGAPHSVVRAPSPVTASLNQTQLDSIVSAAIERWSSTGLTARQLAAMRKIKFEIADLAGDYLGEADGSVIRVDRDAAGNGWFIDLTPFDDAEFVDLTASTRRYADPSGAPAGHLDLLTAVMHELGHRIGLPDTYALLTRDDLMYGYLVKGERRLPRQDEAQDANPNDAINQHFSSLAPDDASYTTRRKVPTQTDSASSSPGATPMEMALIYHSEVQLANHAVRRNVRPSSESDRGSSPRVSKGVEPAPSLTVGLPPHSVPAGLRDRRSEVGNQRSEIRTSNHAVRRYIRPSSQDRNAPTSGETVSLNTIATLPAGKSIMVKYSATVNTPPLARQVSTQGTVSGGNFASKLTDDPEPGGATDPTVTLIDTTSTWTGATSTDWNTVTNWTPNTYAPGVSNPAVNDVVIPNVGAQPNIATTDIGIFSLNISNGRMLTITNPRVLTIGGSPGGDLTLDGIISGGTLNFGTGTHNITNAGGTGSLSSTNVATVISGSTVTLNNNLQAGALAVNSGGSMNITNRTLSLNGSGAALAVQGGGTFTTTGSTVTFNGTAAQQAAGTVYNNLTINNTVGTNITGVTLTGNATVNGVLTLTSSDLDTGANTLTMPLAASSGPATNATDVIGNVKRSGFVSGGGALSFGNPFNTIKINSGAAPTDITVNLVKSSPVGFSQSVQRTYTITPNGANGPAALRLHYLDTELNGNTPESALNLRRFNGTGWQPFVATASNTADATNNWLENNNVSQFSPWTFSNFTPTAAPSMISGHIADANGRAVEGTTINLSGTQTRKTITDANGNYQFLNVETNGFYTVTPSRVNYTFMPFNRSFTQLGNHTDAAFGASFTSDSFNPLDTTEYFVRQQYVDILGREPDEGGFNYWSDQILVCNGDEACIRSRRVAVAAAFFIENEFKQTGSFIYDVYSGALDRRPDFTEYSTDRQQVMDGPNLDTEKASFLKDFVQRAEFTEKYQSATTGESFVDALLQTVQQASGVDLSSQRDSLIADYHSGADLNQSRALVLSDLAGNTSFTQAQYNKAFVSVEYFGYLQRNPDQGGYDFWLNVISNREVGNYRGMVCAFLTSTEYQQRFSSVVTHSNSECGQ